MIFRFGRETFQYPLLALLHIYVYTVSLFVFCFIISLFTLWPYINIYAFTDKKFFVFFLKIDLYTCTVINDLTHNPCKWREIKYTPFAQMHKWHFSAHFSTNFCVCLGYPWYTRLMLSIYKFLKYWSASLHCQWQSVTNYSTAVASKHKLNEASVLINTHCYCCSNCWLILGQKCINAVSNVGVDIKPVLFIQLMFSRLFQYIQD